jgi:hypothetical protein
VHILYEIRTVHLKHANDLLIAVDNEVPSQLFALLFRLDQLVWAHSVQVASVGPQHDRYCAEVHDFLLPIAVIDPPLKPSDELAAVCRMTLSRLGGVDVPVLERKLVRGRQCGLVEEDALDAQV